MHSPTEILVRFFFSLSSPPDSQPPLLIALGILLVSIFTQTYARSAILPYVRLALAVPGIYYAHNHGFGGHETPRRAGYVGMAFASIYCTMRIIDTCIVNFFYPVCPSWVRFGGEKDGEVLPMPTTVLGRLGYAFDLMASVRGTSFFGDRRWDWTPSSVVKQMRKASPRRAYITRHAVSLIFQYLLVDLFETLRTTHTFNTKLAHPVTGDPALGFPAQCMFAFILCMETALNITVPCTLASGIFVALGAAPSSWPAMFADPFRSMSLADFWTHRWHATFRRSFDRLSLLPASIFPKSQRKLARVGVIFLLSGTVHLFLLYPVPMDEEHPHGALLNTSTLKFFLSQPLALLFESLVVQNVTRNLPEPLRTTVDRAWTAGWLLCSGRWYSNVWAGKGMWDPQETLVGFSVIRGLWKGHWDVEV